MKKNNIIHIKITILFLLLSTISVAQKGVGTNNPNAAAALDITSTNKGFLKPRMTSTQRLLIASPIVGLEVFDTTTLTTWYHNGTIWVNSGAATTADLRIVGTDSHITSDAGVGSNGTSAGTGANNILIGKESGKGLTNQSNNVFIGNLTGGGTTVNSVFVGHQAGNLNSGTLNTFLGYQTGLVNTSGGSNTFIGSGAGTANATGANNVYIGQGAGANTVNASNVFIGSNAGLNATGANNVYIGTSSGLNATNSGTVFIGDGTGLVNTGNRNTFVGRSAGSVNTSGNQNTFLGGRSGIANTIGASNTFVGLLAGGGNTEGNSNVFVGTNAGLTNTTKDQNVYVGNSAGQNATSAQSVFIGDNAGRKATANENIFIGYRSGNNTLGGASNLFLGYDSGLNNSTGNTNLFLGYKAGDGNTTGSSNLIVGTNLEAPLTTGDNQMNIAGIIFGEGVNNVTGSTISSGRIGLGILPHATDKLHVGGNIRTTGTLTTAGATYPDYVFEKVLEGNSKIHKTYTFKSLSEVEAFIKLNKHLPGVTSIGDLKKNNNGDYMINISELSVQTLEKVEELYLHAIAQQKKIDVLQKENKDLQMRLLKIESILGVKE